MVNFFVSWKLAESLIVMLPLKVPALVGGPVKPMVLPESNAVIPCGKPLGAQTMANAIANTRQNCLRLPLTLSWLMALRS